MLKIKLKDGHIVLMGFDRFPFKAEVFTKFGVIVGLVILKAKF